MASARVAREVILMPESTLLWLEGAAEVRLMDGLLGFELVGENKVRVADDLLVGGYDVVVDVKTALVAHYGVQDCAWLLAIT